MESLLIIISTAIFSGLAVTAIVEFIKSKRRPYHYVERFNPKDFSYTYIVYFGFNQIFIREVNTKEKAERIVKEFNRVYANIKKETP